MPTVYVTAPQDSAAEIAETLVEERLAACVNRVDCDSTYWWDGAVQTDAEAILLAKTTDDRFEESDVWPAFADWRAEAVRQN